MNIKKLSEVNVAVTGITGFFSAYGSFGIADGRDEDISLVETTENGYKAEYEKFGVTCEYKEYEDGVYLRRDCFTAKSDLVLNSYASRFLIEDGDYEVYTQYNSWQNESGGDWQPLITSVEVSNIGIRTTEGANPMIAIRNKGNGRIIVFHLIPNAQWKMRVSRVPKEQKNDAILIETGINNQGLAMKIRAGETIEMPKVYLYDTHNSIDLDAWKLHSAFLKDYPRKSLPIIYNTWLCNFDNVTYDEIIRQADTAAELGIEYFLIDAGWFGSKDSWFNSIGEWYEKPEGRFEGRLSEISEYIRGLGIRFGLWIEPERALMKLDIVKSHPEYYYFGNDGNAFLNYGCDEAREYILETISTIIDKYSLSYMKFDFNAPLAFDETQNGFYRYFEGQKKLITALREKYPYLYLTSCASGGGRLDMGQMECFDSVWYSDNQSPVSGLRIYKDTSKRHLPCAMEKWDVRLFCNGFPKYGSEEPAELPLSCHNATWDNVVIVKPSFTHAFLTGGVMGFSANIADYPAEEKNALKNLIANYKENRDFYKNAVMRILHDTRNITVLQYSHCQFAEHVIQVFFGELFQKDFTFYPILDGEKIYSLNGESVKGRELMSNGIQVAVEEHSCKTITLKALN